MPVTVERVLTLPDLRLRLVTSGAGTGREIRWVHVSETIDPTPWLRGGELLLTTGLKIDRPCDFGPYVERLAAAGLAGLGFGVGLGYEEVPGELIAAANAAQLPVLEIPVDVPYMAISEAVSQLLTAERYDHLTRAFDAQQALTAAALDDGVNGIVAAVSRAIEGWAVLTDTSARPLHVWPPSAVQRVPSLRPDIVRTRQRGLRSSSSVSAPTESTITHALGARGRMRGFLVTGFPGQPSGYTRSVLSGAVALLSLELERRHAASSQIRRLRAAAVDHIVRGGIAASLTAQHLAAWELDATDVRVSVLLAARGRGQELFDRVTESLTDSGLPAAAALQQARPHDRVVVLTSGGDEPLRVLEALASTRPLAALGIGEAVAAGDLPHAYRAALHAAQVGLTERRAVTRYEDLQALKLFFHSQSSEALSEFVARVLGDLTAHDLSRDGSLRATLRAFLANNGQWNVTAADLGIHRHTLRARVERIERLTGRSLDSAYDRMELWLALLAESSDVIDTDPARNTDTVSTRPV